MTSPLVLLDLDGTLIDSIPGITASLAVAFRRCGLPVPTAAEPEPATSALMVGDREHDVHGARENGLDCVGVTWGYAAPGELAAAGALEIVETPAHLLRTVLRRLVADAA